MCPRLWYHYNLEILRAWAAALEHPLSQFLEEPFWKPMAEEKRKVDRHFNAVRLSVPDLRGVELRDRNDRPEPETAEENSGPEGITRMVWRLYEIENYLIHPDAILRWLRTFGDDAVVERAKKYMQGYFPPIVHWEPFSADYFQTNGKRVLGEVCEAARLPVREAEYYEIATGMLRDEIHPEVVEKLDAMAEQLIIGENGQNVQVP